VFSEFVRLHHKLKGKYFTGRTVVRKIPFSTDFSKKRKKFNRPYIPIFTCFPPALHIQITHNCKTHSSCFVLINHFRLCNFTQKSRFFPITSSLYLHWKKYIKIIIIIKGYQQSSNFQNSELELE
jgi:hypothetical protein